MLDFDWSSLFYKALNLKKQYSINFHEDLHWLFSYKIAEYLKTQGIDNVTPSYIRPYLSKIWEIQHGEQKIPRYTPVCSSSYYYLEDVYRYGFSGESGAHASLIFRQWCGVQYNLQNYLDFPPILIGNFGFLLDNKYIQKEIAIPEQLNLVGVVKFTQYKKQFIYTWIGVFLNSDLNFRLPNKEIILPDEPYYYIYGSLFMRYYANGDYSQDENELRKQHGFPKKGTRGTGELILYHTVCRIFQDEPIKRHYRGKELHGYEIDIWLPDRKIGFEFQGEQHFREVKLWHREHGFEEQKKRDKTKKKLFKELGYTVLYFNKNDDLSHKGVLRALRAELAIIPTDDCFVTQ